MKIITPTDQAELDAKFGVNDYDDHPEDGHVSPLGEMPPRLKERLDELGQHLPEGASITMARDWERCIFGLVEYPEGTTHRNTDWPGFDVLAFGENGAVGHGGVNLPRMHDTVAELLEVDGDR
jgi:hypothetical protein